MDSNFENKINYLKRKDVIALLDHFESTCDQLIEIVDIIAMITNIDELFEEMSHDIDYHSLANFMKEFDVNRFFREQNSEVIDDELRF